jgi:hypothetical protein
MGERADCSGAASPDMAMQNGCSRGVNRIPRRVPGHRRQDLRRLSLREPLSAALQHGLLSHTDRQSVPRSHAERLDLLCHDVDPGHFPFSVTSTNEPWMLTLSPSSKLSMSGICESCAMTRYSTSFGAVLRRKGAALPTQTELNAGLAAVDGMRPADEIEATLAIHGRDASGMRCARREALTDIYGASGSSHSASARRRATDCRPLCARERRWASHRRYGEPSGGWRCAYAPPFSDATRAGYVADQNGWMAQLST